MRPWLSGITGHCQCSVGSSILPGRTSIKKEPLGAFFVRAPEQVPLRHLRGESNGGAMFSLILERKQVSRVLRSCERSELEKAGRFSLAAPIKRTFSGLFYVARGRSFVNTKR